MRHPITKKPEKIRTHSRYEMSQRVYKNYVKCSCSTPLILVSDVWTTCSCGLKFMGGYSMKQPYGQGAPWPTALKQFTRDKKSSYTVAPTLDQSAFNLGRHTKKLISEIQDLGGNVRICYEPCTDGRDHVSSISYEYSHRKVRMEGILYFNIHPENRSNRVINEQLNYFLADLRSLRAFMVKYNLGYSDNLSAKDETGNWIRWKADNYEDYKEVSVDTMMEYSY